jgi:hypothetical protein
MFSIKTKAEKNTVMHSDFKPDITPLESALIAKLYYMAGLGLIQKPEDFKEWDLVKRHWVIEKRK